MRTHVMVSLIALVGTILSLSGPARAQATASGVVVLVKEKEVVLDLGTERGGVTGAKVRFFRKVVVHHPVTGVALEDRFPIGETRLDEVSQLLAIVRSTKGFARPPEVGDYVELVAAVPAAKPAGKVAPAAPAAPVAVEVPVPDPETEALAKAFHEGAGLTPEARREKYFAFLSAWPSGRFAGDVAREIAWLNDLASGATRARPKAQTPPPATRRSVVVGSPAEVEIGDPVDIVIAVLPTDDVAAVRLMVRAAKEGTFETIVMERRGDYYYHGRVPARFVAEPGRFGYFIELLDNADHVQAVAGRSAEPRWVAVDRPPDRTPVRDDRSRARVMFDYVNFDKRHDVDDEYWGLEADFLYRINVPVLYGLLVGVGLFNGTGGPLAEIESSPDLSRDQGVAYGYLGVDLEIVSIFHLTLRGMAGNSHEERIDDTDVAAEERSKAVGVLGFEGGVMLGQPEGTKLELSGALFEDVGNEGRIVFTLGVLERVPIFVGGVVTDFPVDGADIGMRILLGAGLKITDWMKVLAHGSWNLRTIQHTGFGGGGSVAFMW